MYLDINNNKYEIVIERKNNKNTYIRVKDDLKIHVTTNKWTREKEIKKLITDNYDAIIKMINRELKKKENNKKHYGNQNRSPGNIAPFYNCVHSSLLLPPKIHTILKIRITRLLNLSYNFWLLPTKRKFSASLLHPDSSPGQCNSTFPKPAM